MAEEPKFKRGHTVKILSRRAKSDKWENTNVDGEGIVEEFKYAESNVDYLHPNLYKLWVMYDNPKNRLSIKWFEENFLEMVCSNETRGEKILAELQSKHG